MRTFVFTVNVVRTMLKLCLKCITLTAFVFAVLSIYCRNMTMMGDVYHIHHTVILDQSMNVFFNTLVL